MTALPEKSDSPQSVAHDVRTARLLAFLATARGKDGLAARLLACAAEWQRDDERRDEPRRLLACADEWQRTGANIGASGEKRRDIAPDSTDPA